MVFIRGFRGLRYKTDNSDVSDFLSPPYDVIDREGWESLAGRSPYNSVRLSLPKAIAPYKDAAAKLADWQSQQILVRDDVPAVYRYHQEFALKEFGNTPVVRKGFICSVRLSDYAEGQILPHERTLSGPKADRLSLMQHTNCHFSQIFALYKDPKQTVAKAFVSQETRPPDSMGTTEDGVHHKLWRCIDAEIIAELQGFFTEKKLYIADGHHRYETMLALKKHYAQKQTLSPDSAAHFGMMFLANTEDPGLVVLPTHRVVHSVPPEKVASLPEVCRKYFTVTNLQQSLDGSFVRNTLAKASVKGPSVIMVFPKDSSVTADGCSGYLLTVKAGAWKEWGDTVAEGVQKLDVSVLHTIILEKLLGIDKAAQEKKTNLDYIKDTDVALERMQQQDGQVAFLMHPTHVSQVCAVAEAGLVMPQKSTYFVPKIATGLVFSPIDPQET